jgi:hypothetical protein
MTMYDFFYKKYISIFLCMCVHIFFWHVRAPRQRRPPPAPGQRICRDMNDAGCKGCAGGRCAGRAAGSPA